MAHRWEIYQAGQVLTGRTMRREAKVLRAAARPTIPSVLTPTRRSLSNKRRSLVGKRIPNAQMV